MKLLILLIFFVISVQSKNNLGDNEFAEFEVLDESISETEDNFSTNVEIDEKKEERTNPEVIF